MQISRHWRLNAQRYRLEGFRNRKGEVSLQARPSAIKPAAARDMHYPEPITATPATTVA